MQIPPDHSEVTAGIADFCLKPEFEKTFSSEFLLARRNENELALISFKIILNDVVKEHDYVQRFDEYVNLLLEVIARRLRRTDIACQCSSLHVVIMCRRTTQQNAAVIAEQIQEALQSLISDTAAAESFVAFSLRVNCLSTIELDIDKPDRMFEYLVTA